MQFRTGINIRLENRTRFPLERLILSSPMACVKSELQLRTAFAHLQWRETSTTEKPVLRSLKIHFQHFHCSESLILFSMGDIAWYKEVQFNKENSVLRAFRFGKLSSPNSISRIIAKNSVRQSRTSVQARFSTAFTNNSVHKFFESSELTAHCLNTVSISFNCEK